MAKPRPTLKAAITCDQAIKEAGTNKWTLVGTFSHIGVPVPPELDIKVAVDPNAQLQIQHGQLGVYFCVGNAEGEYDVELQFVKLAAEETLIAKAQTRIKAQDRLLPTDFALNVRNVLLPGFGRYAIKLLMDGQLIDEKPFDVVKLIMRKNKAG